MESNTIVVEMFGEKGTLRVRNTMDNIVNFTTEIFSNGFRIDVLIDNEMDNLEIALLRDGQVVHDDDAFSDVRSYLTIDEVKDLISKAKALNANHPVQKL